MKAFLIFITLLVLGAMVNGASLNTIVVVLLLGFMLYSMGSKTKSVTEITSSHPIDRMVEDFGKVAANITKGKQANIGVDTIVNGTKNIVEDTKSAFK